MFFLRIYHVLVVLTHSFDCMSYFHIYDVNFTRISRI